MFDITLLGCGGTMPYYNRYLSSLLCRFNGETTLIDCGEATQMAIKKAGYTFKHIETLCITHFHADHISGLPGLLLSMGNEGKESPLLIVGPAGAANVTSHLRVICPELPFKINIQELSSPVAEIKLSKLTLTAFRVSHTIPTYGYALSVSRVGRFNPDKAKENCVPMAVWSRLQKAESAEHEGIVYTREQILEEPRKGLRVVYCTDTRPCAVISEMASDADLFVCEGMYGDEEKRQKAEETKHMLFTEAAMLAASAETPPKRLWLTHYSPSLTEAEKYIERATEVFPDTETGFDGKTVTLRFEN